MFCELVSTASSKTSSNPGSANSFVPTALADYTVDKSVEFSYEELANATNGFSVTNKIGEGGFAVVYYGEIRGQVILIIDLVNLSLCVFFLFRRFLVIYI